jgi:Flp pilus assembly protein TadG
MMIEPQANRFREFAARIGAALLASALAVMAAQTGATRPAGVQDHLRKAAAYLKANDPNSAVQGVQCGSGKLDPKNAEAYANLGVIAFFRHDYQKAAHICVALWRSTRPC